MSTPVKSERYNAAVRKELAELWKTMEITDPDRFERDVMAAKNGRNLYQRIGMMTDGIPWYVIAAIHGLECSFDFTRHLHNGDSLKARTVNEPEGRPLAGKAPFTFIESAVDALTFDKLDRVQDWSIEHALWLLEGFNGHGYRMYRGIHSPYLWAGTNHYTKGKYVSDGKYDANVVSKQAGVAGLISLIFREGIK